MRNATKEFEIEMRVGHARLLSAVVVLSLLIGYLGAALVGDARGAVDLALTITKLVGLLGAILLFLSNYGQLSQRKESQLDEREVQVRNRAYVLTHQIMVTFLFLAFLWVDIAARAGWWLPATRDVGDLLTALAIASMALPAAILAWRDRPVASDELEA